MAYFNTDSIHSSFVQPDDIPQDDSHSIEDLLPPMSDELHIREHLIKYHKGKYPYDRRVPFHNRLIFLSTNLQSLLGVFRFLRIEPLMQSTDIDLVQLAKAISASRPQEVHRPMPSHPEKKVQRWVDLFSPKIDPIVEKIQSIVKEETIRAQLIAYHEQKSPYDGRGRGADTLLCHTLEELLPKWRFKTIAPLFGGLKVNILTLAQAILDSEHPPTTDRSFPEDALNAYLDSPSSQKLLLLGSKFGPRYCTKTHLDLIKEQLDIPPHVESSINNLSDLIIHLTQRYMISGVEYQMLINCLVIANAHVQEIEPPRPEKSPETDAPDYFICPISQDLMEDPMIDNEGHSYSKKEIEKWLNDHATSPITRKPLKLKDLRPNRALQEAIADFKEKK